MAVETFKPGDVIGFSGGGFLSTVIKLGSFASPFSGISHVGIVSQARGHGVLLFESTSMEDLPCDITGKRIAGVQAHNLDAVVNSYAGRAYHYSLYRYLYRHESSRLTTFLMQLVGTRYDRDGAIHSGGLLYGAINALTRGQDLSALFCSELVAAALATVGVLHTENASRWNPTLLVRTLRRHGLVGTPRRLK